MSVTVELPSTELIRTELASFESEIAGVVTVELTSTELSKTELASLESDIAGVLTAEDGNIGRLEVIVRVTRLHNVELTIALSDVVGLNETQLVPLSTKEDVKSMGRE